MKILLTICLVTCLIGGAALASEANLSFDSYKTPTAITPNVPDPNIILQGGDTINDATVIDALPYNTTGTTTAFGDDYDEVCNYSGSTSPDVVYSFTPTADVTVDISLCANSDYDTKLYVYEDSVGNLVDCIDDNCPLYQSELTGLSLTLGNTYYIVVDGFGGEFGNYSFDMVEVVPPPPPPNCDDGLFGQVTHQPSDAWSAATSDAGSPGPYLTYDNFNSGGVIGAIKFWGLDLLYNNGWSDCVEDPMTFEINFYEDSNGMPGTMLESFTVACDIVPTNLQYSGYDLNEYYAILSPSFVADYGWVSIQGISAPSNCWFLWMSGNGIDGNGYQWDGQNLNVREYDQGYCLYTEMTSVDETADLLPTEMDILTSYPNPFNAKTTIAFSLKEAGNVSIAIHDLLGRRDKCVTVS